MLWGLLRIPMALMTMSMIMWPGLILDKFVNLDPYHLKTKEEARKYKQEHRGLYISVVRIAGVVLTLGY